MKCGKFHRQISMLIDDELAGPAAEALRLHLERCANCRSVYERMVTLSNELREARGQVTASSLPVKVKERIALEAARGQAKQFLPGWGQVPLMAMVILLAIGLGNLAGRSVNQMLHRDRSKSMLEYVLPDQNQSFAEVVMEIRAEENSR